MGFRNLELVTPGYFRTKEAKRMAYQAYNLLKQAPVYAKFDDAIHDKHLIGRSG